MRDMFRTLKLILQHRFARDSQRLQSDQDELLWSFAFLLADPPSGLLSVVQSFLVRHRIESYVRQKPLQ